MIILIAHTPRKSSGAGLTAKLSKKRRFEKSTPEGGYEVAQGEAPDFLVSAPGKAFTVEATTVAPSREGVLAERPETRTPEQLAAFLADYMPIKFGSSLTNKLHRRSASGKAYWEEDRAAGLPFVIAVADFHKPASADEPGSMTYTQSAIWPYLYGFTTDWEMIDGKLVIIRRDLTSHTFKGKVIESGFFSLPKAENVSAVLFSNAGTSAKFDRIGVLAGFGSPHHRYLRVGFRFDPDPNAPSGKRFVEEVGAGDYSEGWAEELQVFHNPNALRPLPKDYFGGLTQHFFDDGQIVTYASVDAVLSSYTIMVGPGDGPEGRG
jgi:hypothetical protein